MSDFKILHVGDEHLADVPPSCRKVSYKDDILAKEREIVKIAKEYKVDAIVRTGDIFHIKSPSRNSHGMVSELIDIWKLFRDIAPNYLCIGNHDLRNDSLSSLPDQPIRELIAAEVVTPIPEGETGILIRKSAKSPIRIAALYGYGNPDSGARDRYKMTRDSEEEILIKATHSCLFPVGKKFPTDKVEVTNLDQIVDHGPDLYLAGHIHDYYGVTHVKDTYLSMPGSISRGSLPEVDAARPIVVTLVSVEKRGTYRFEEIPLKTAKPVKDVFTLPLSEIQKAQNIELESDAAIDKYVGFLKESTSDNDQWSLKSEILRASSVGLPKSTSDYLVGVCEDLSIN